MYELCLYAGAGLGLLGTHLLGFRPVGYVEWNDYCQRVIAARIQDGILPVAPIFGDVRAFISEGYARAYQGLVDVVTAGFPCQPFSNAGKQLGDNDPRNMWPATNECIRIVRPRYCLLENVAALITKPYFGTILGDLAESGYGVRWRRLSAAEVGAPHFRDRVWIVAYPNQDQRQLHERGVQAKIQMRYDTDGGGSSIDDVANAQRQGCGQMANKDQDGRRYAELERGNWWAVEPRLGRLADGRPSRVDRLAALGNGQVPAVVRTAWRLLTEGLEP